MAGCLYPTFCFNSFSFKTKRDFSFILLIWIQDWELHPLKHQWLVTCLEKGFILPICFLRVPIIATPLTCLSLACFCYARYVLLIEKTGENCCLYVDCTIENKTDTVWAKFKFSQNCGISFCDFNFPGGIRWDEPAVIFRLQC